MLSASGQADRAARQREVREDRIELLDASEERPLRAAHERAFGDLGAAGPVRLVIRPERVELEPHGTTGENRVPGMVERVVYVGATTQVIVRLAPGDTVQMLLKNEGGEVAYQQGTPVSVHLPAAALRVLAES